MDQTTLTSLSKSPTGIRGLDEITYGGFPQGRPTLVCGGAGCGKTLLGMEFLIRGILDYAETGVFVTFEESPGELARNFTSLGVDLNVLVNDKKLALEHVQVERSEIEETGEYNLEGLFIRLANAIDSVGARRLVLDTIEALFSALPNEFILRSELRRLFRWLKDHGVTAVITGERGEKTLTRYGLEEYVADCVIVLDHRLTDQIATRRLRIVKYRGSIHGADEYPFLIDEHGISVLPVTSLHLRHTVSTERISSGVARLDAMLGGEGYYRGSSILVSGTAGTGKTSLAASFAHAACARGERCLYMAYEESEPQVVRNMRSIGVDLQPWIDGDLLKIVAARASAYGLELHLATIHNAITQCHPRVVVIDPISSLMSVGSYLEVSAMLTRLVDHLKTQQITAFLTSLTHFGGTLEATDIHMSSLIDTWLGLYSVESSGERNRLLYLLKSRGMAHSNQVREFLITDQGIELRDVYLGTHGVLTGTARMVQEADDTAQVLVRKQDIQRRRRELERKREAVEARIIAVRAEHAAEVAEAEALIAEEERREAKLDAERADRAAVRGVDAPKGGQS